MAQQQPLRIGLVGTGFMAKAHSFGYHEAPHFYDLKLRPELAVLCGRDASRLELARTRYGWQEGVTDWRRVVERSDLDLIDISSPGDTHAPIALAAAAQGKHIFCEKPLATTLDEAQAMYLAAHSAGVRHVVGFNNRYVPAIALLRELIAEHRLGRIRHVRACWLSDMALDADAPMAWRYQRSRAGHGALGDLGAHLVDLARFLAGEITEVTGMTQTFVAERPLPDTDTWANVTVDDASAFLARFSSGALGVFEMTRSAFGHADEFTISVNGTEGSASYRRTRPNELTVRLADDKLSQGRTTVHVTGQDWPAAAPFWPKGHGIDYGESFISQAAALLEHLSGVSRPEVATFYDGERCQAVLEAVGQSAQTGQWQGVAPAPQGSAAKADPHDR